MFCNKLNLHLKSSLNQLRAQAHAHNVCVDVWNDVFIVNYSANLRHAHESDCNR